jgi:hypothetical protein
LKWIKKKLGGRWTGRKEAEKTEEEHTEKSEWSTTMLKEHFLSRAAQKLHNRERINLQDHNSYSLLSTGLNILPVIE